VVTRTLLPGRIGSRLASDRELNRFRYGATGGVVGQDRDEIGADTPFVGLIFRDAFAREEVDVVVATIAFRMGIDKSNKLRHRPHPPPRTSLLGTKPDISTLC